MNLRPRYYELLNAAHSASEDVDLFDLDSRDGASVARFAALTASQSDAQAELIRYIAEGGQELLAQLGDQQTEGEAKLPPLDEFHQHEVLHGTAMVASLFDQYVEQHRYTQSDPDLRAAAEAIGASLANFYQALGAGMANKSD